MSTAPEKNATIMKQNGLTTALPTLTLENIRKYICKTATDSELMLFFVLCKLKNYNPFLKEAHLIKYKDNPAFMVIAKDTFLREAQSLSDYEGFEAGIYIKGKDGKITESEGGYYDGELDGGWARVYRRGKKPFFNSIRLVDYKPKNPHPSTPWAKMPAVMVRKVPLVQSLREAFPEKFGGIYEEPEMTQALPGNINQTEFVNAHNPEESLMLEHSKGKDKIQEMEELMDTKKELVEPTKGLVKTISLTPENITDINPEETEEKSVGYLKQLPRYPNPDDLEKEAIDIDIFMGRVYELSGSPQYIIDSLKKLGQLPVLKNDSFVFLVREKKYCGWSFNAWPMDKKDENKKDMLTIIHPKVTKFPRISFRFDNGELISADETRRIYGDYEITYFLRATGFGVNWVIAPQKVYEAYKAEYR